MRPILRTCNPSNSMLPTPSTSHIDTNRIYEPSEDSYLLLDTLSSESEIDFLTKRFGQCQDAGGNDPSNPSPLILEVGTGSGVVLALLVANARKIFGREDVVPLGTDVNRCACQATLETVLASCSGSSGLDGIAVQKPLSTAAPLASAICADLTGPIRAGAADVLIFNPPYVPTPSAPTVIVEGYEETATCTSKDVSNSIRSYEQDSHLLSLSYAGGVDGMEVTNRLLQQLPSVLNRLRGVAYVLLCQQNKPEEVVHRVKDWGREWNAVIVGRSGKKAGWEKLVVIKIWIFS